MLVFLPRSNWKPCIVAFRCGLASLILLTAVFAIAQTNTAAILGTVTDASGASVPDATVRVTNTGTAASQVTTTTAEGRYLVPALPIGDYDVQVEKQGFQTVDHKGITLTVGSQQVVDFALTVGQMAQTVTVESEVTRVETTSSEVSTLVSPTQMRELPLNGRDFEQLVLLAPGVTVTQNIGHTFSQGQANGYSASGSRTRGQEEILDDNDILDFIGRNAGSGIIGTSLGVDAVAEFKVLTGTYGAQYGGNGSVMTSVTKSGTNSFHGSAYEFLRNSALDARNFFDPPTIPEFEQNQFGGTLGGPIKKDKMFFFVNYEGLRSVSNPVYGFNLPDQAAHNGFVNGACVEPGSTAATTQAQCATMIPPQIQQFLQYFPNPNQFTHGPDTPTTGTETAEIPMKSPVQENYVVARYDWTISSKDSIFGRYLLDYAYLFDVSSPVPSTLAPTGWSSLDHDHDQFLSVEEKRIWSSNFITSTRGGFSRTGIFVDIPASENYNPSLWNFENESTYGYPTFDPGSITLGSLTNPNIPRASLGGYNGNTELIQNKFSGGEDIYWNKGAHALQFGGSITRQQSYKFIPPTNGTWSFSGVTSFLQDEPTNFSGTCLAQITACANLGFTSTPVEPLEFLESDFAFYIQDSWKIRRTVTLNLGLRYSPTTNPVGASNYLAEALNLPLSQTYNPALPMPGCQVPVANPTAPTVSNSIACPSLPVGVTGYTSVHNVYQQNPSFHTFDPRIGVAWDPFPDHKTSVRAAYGMYHYPVLAYDYTSAFTNAPAGTSFTQTCAALPCTFPTPFNSLTAATPSVDGGIDPGNTSTPYMEQYNLTVQRELPGRTTLSVAYMGSTGVHLPGELDENPSLPDGVPGAITVPTGSTIYPYLSSQLPCTGGLTPVVTATAAGPASGCVNNTASSIFLTAPGGQPIVDPANGKNTYSNVICKANGSCAVTPNNRIDPALGFWNLYRTSGFWSHYNSMQIGLTRQAAGLQTQVSYTLASCLTNSSGIGPVDGQIVNADSYNVNVDREPCSFLERNNFYVTGLYNFPFQKNRLVGGWQLGGIFQYHPGGLLTAATGWSSGFTDRASTVTNNRPDLLPNCNQVNGTVAAWLNTSCYTMPPIGEIGNLGGNTIEGPNSMTLDASLVKNTRISERFNLQIRLEGFNVLNRANFRNPGEPLAPVYTAATVTPACAVNANLCSTLNPNQNQLTLTNTSSRQIQLGMKLIF